MKSRKHVGVVIDKRFWGAVDNLPVEVRACYYLFEAKPFYWMLKEYKSSYLIKGLGRMDEKV